MSSSETDKKARTARGHTIREGDLTEAIQHACRRVAPLWPLSNFVAVNPFLGFSEHHFDETARIHARIRSADTVPDIAYFSRQFNNGAIGMEDIAAALRTARPEVLESLAANGRKPSAEDLITRLSGSDKAEEELFQSGPFSRFLDRREHTVWRRFIREEAAKWCAAYFDKGQSAWPMPWKNLEFFNAWKRASRHDRNAGFSGWNGFRDQVAELPDSPEEMIRVSMQLLEVPEASLADMLFSVLLTLPGWAGHLQYRDREKSLRGEQGDELLQLLAVLCAYEAMLFQQHQSDRDCVLAWKRSLIEDPEDAERAEGTPIPGRLAERLVWQAAHERSFERDLRTRLRARKAARNDTVDTRPAAQAVFCIDVRSELFRRALESVDASVQTVGFAGFFGLAIEYKELPEGETQARCPALFAPPIENHDRACNDTCCSDRHQRDLGTGWKRFREAAASCFTFVETLGLAYLPKLVRETFGIAASNEAVALPSHAQLDALPLETRIKTAEGMLKGLGLTSNFGRLVLFCGHGGSSRNNPYASSLDCGACGGHAGDANARLAAHLLNNPEVRDGLGKRGLVIPQDTVFIAGLHNTTSDEVRLFDTERVPASHTEDLRNLEHALHAAGEQTVLMRAPRMDGPASGRSAVKSVRRRANDWSQVRPEWGLAGNAAFIAAPREWTRQVDLKGRAFLHDYDAAKDSKGEVLEAIMAGPLTVASWINLQYYASTTDHAHFGSGHKSIHNAMAGLGIALGNENDLRPGLPFQSVHNGEKWMHEPLRLHACIAAKPDVIDQILERQPGLQQLFRNEWIHLLALGDNNREWLRRRPNGGWRA